MDTKVSYRIQHVAYVTKIDKGRDMIVQKFVLA